MSITIVKHQNTIYAVPSVTLNQIPNKLDIESRGEYRKIEDNRGLN